MIRELTKHEFRQAAELSLKVFTHCGIGDFNDEGLETFKSFIFGDTLTSELIIYGAFDKECLIGVLGIKSEKKHISLFFVHPDYHRKGFGKVCQKQETNGLQYTPMKRIV